MTCYYVSFDLNLCFYLLPHTRSDDLVEHFSGPLLSLTDPNVTVTKSLTTVNYGDLTSDLMIYESSETGSRSFPRFVPELDPSSTLSDKRWTIGVSTSN